MPLSGNPKVTQTKSQQLGYYRTKNCMVNSDKSMNSNNFVITKRLQTDYTILCYSASLLHLSRHGSHKIIFIMIKWSQITEQFMFIIKTITFIIITSNFLSFYFLPRIQIYQRGCSQVVVSPVSH